MVANLSVVILSSLFSMTNSFALYEPHIICRNSRVQPFCFIQSSLQLDIVTKTSFTQNCHKSFSIAAKRRGSEDDYLGSFSKEGKTPERVSFGTEAIPEGQRPANEYLDLMNSPLFDWAISNQGLLQRLIFVYIASFFVVSLPIAGATFTEESFFIQKIAAANVGTMSIILLLLVRLYTGWGYVGSRLQTTVVEYEETGWYDGAFERKTETEKKRDLFLYQNNVKPVIERVKLFSFSVGAIWLASCVALKVATDINPMFNSYNPNMLKELQSNEKLADYSAQKSNGMPTYCNNRYYRAVANGGQGCDK